MKWFIDLYPVIFTAFSDIYVLLPLRVVRLILYRWRDSKILEFHKNINKQPSLFTNINKQPSLFTNLRDDFVYQLYTESETHFIVFSSCLGLYKNILIFDIIINITGWGITQAGGSLSNVLRFTTVRAWNDNDRCDNKFGSSRFSSCNLNVKIFQLKFCPFYKCGIIPTSKSLIVSIQPIINFIANIDSNWLCARLTGTTNYAGNCYGDKGAPMLSANGHRLLGKQTLRYKLVPWTPSGR